MSNLNNDLLRDGQVVYALAGVSCARASGVIMQRDIARAVARHLRTFRGGFGVAGTFCKILRANVFDLTL